MIIRYLLLITAVAPLVLAWIIIRGHALSWPRGEMTAVIAIAALTFTRVPRRDRPAGDAAGADRHQLRLVDRAGRRGADPDRVGVAGQGERRHAQAAGSCHEPRARARPGRSQPGSRAGPGDRGRGAGRGPHGRSRATRRAPTRPPSTRCATCSTSVSMDGVVVIGEGEKDEAPMLYNGEQIGDGSPPEVDIAVDPLEGTRLTALGHAERDLGDRAGRARHDVQPGPDRLHGEDRRRARDRRPARPRPARCPRRWG